MLEKEWFFILFIRNTCGIISLTLSHIKYFNLFLVERAGNFLYEIYVDGVCYSMILIYLILIEFEKLKGKNYYIVC